MHKIRVRIGLFVVISAILLSSIQFSLFNIKLYKNEIEFYPGGYPGKEEFSRHEEQFKAIKEALPSHGSIGYITDDISKGFNRESGYFVAQYMLSPLIVLNSADQEYVISNFYHPINPEIYKKYNLVPEKDFGGGIILFKRVDN